MITDYPEPAQGSRYWYNDEKANNPSRRAAPIDLGSGRHSAGQCSSNVEGDLRGHVKDVDKIYQRRPGLIDALFAAYRTDQHGEVRHGMLPWLAVRIDNRFQKSRLGIAPPRGRPQPAACTPRFGVVTRGDRDGIIVPGAKLTVSFTAQ